MQPRLKYGQLAPEALARMQDIEHYLNTGTNLEPALQEFVRLLVSYRNGCEYCIKVHTKELEKRNETPERIAGVTAWRESDLYTQREYPGWPRSGRRIRRGQGALQ